MGGGSRTASKKTKKTRYGSTCDPHGKQFDSSSFWCFGVFDEHGTEERGGKEKERREGDVPIHIDEILELIDSKMLHHSLTGDSTDLACVHLLHVLHELLTLLGVRHLQHVLSGGGRVWGGKEGEYLLLGAPRREL